MTTKTKHHSRPKTASSRRPRPRPVTDTARTRTAARKPKHPPARRRRRFDPSWGQLIAVGAVAVAGAFLLFGGRSATGGAVKPKQAPGFSLPSTAGGTASLSDFAGHNVLLYFNEGVGCDACFYQTEELEKSADQFAAKDIQVVPIVMNPIDDVRGQLARFGITTPYLIDDGTVSSAYGVLGKGMHANLPGHGFVLIDKTGMIRWEKEYPSMYASAGEVLSAVSPYA